MVWWYNRSKTYNCISIILQYTCYTTWFISLFVSFTNCISKVSFSRLNMYGFVCMFGVGCFVFCFVCLSSLFLAYIYIFSPLTIKNFFYCFFFLLVVDDMIQTKLLPPAPYFIVYIRKYLFIYL